MFLTKLKLRGFKSFADATVLEFEPGITVIVGPNGSGKSNVVDALTWVLGSSSPKSLRGAAMSDVIFAGSGSGPGPPGRRDGRAALGRAAVEITIDNSSGELPIEFNEVTVGRSMFADGENHYSINGVECRLLDVSELLSDTGLGREAHTIVSQGRLDAVLDARPEERRAFVEEAAGILKHRRRKERALRKLAQMEAHVERLGDLVRELQRQLRPLERQAEAAARSAALAEELREVRRTRALRELAALVEADLDEESGRAASEAAMAHLDERIASLRASEGGAEAELARLAPAARAAGETHFRLANLLERTRGLAERITERRDGLAAAVEEPVAGRDPEELRARAREDADLLGEVDDEHRGARTALEAAEADRHEAERARRAHEQAAAAEARRRAEARERVLRWEGEVAALRSTLTQASAEEGRLAAQFAGLAARTAALDRDTEAVQADLRRTDAAAGALDQHLRAAQAEVADRDRAAAEAVRAERELERRRASLEARADALRAASTEVGEGAAALRAAAADGRLAGLRGAIAEHVSVEPEAVTALAAALGPLGDGLLVATHDDARAAVRLAGEGTGRVVVLPAAPAAVPPVPAAVDGARALADAVDGDEAVVAALRLALRDTYLVDDVNAACTIAAKHPGFVFVTLDGEVIGPDGWAAGTATGAGAVVARAAAQRAEADLVGVVAQLRGAAAALVEADRELQAERGELAAAVAAVQESDALLTAAAERLRRLQAERRGAAGEHQALQSQAEQLDRELAARRDRLAALEVAGPGQVDAEEPGADVEAERLDDALAEAREAEVQARLAVATSHQRAAELRRRADGLRREADDVERRLAERERRRLTRIAAIERCARLSTVAAAAVARAEDSVARAAAERDDLDERRSARQRDLGGVRATLRDVESERGSLVGTQHATQLRRAELHHALEAVRARVSALGLDPSDALAEAREGQALEGGDDVEATLAESEERLVRTISLLGVVNPLAADELQSASERHAFLTAQLDDLAASRRDLLSVVEAVDGRIREVFGAAFADVAAQFEEMFPRMFPGGEGRLVLTDPDDLLTTGIEVEARPPGKRVKRLSLLSGGERSLTALAVLFAIFAARPSPFYVLDEVEAALDDVNLQRFLEVLGDFRGTSQLLVVSHQRRTMEVADTLYGVSMRSDGVSKVISQRTGEPAPTG